MGLLQYTSMLVCWTTASQVQSNFNVLSAKLSDGKVHNSTTFLERCIFIVSADKIQKISMQWYKISHRYTTVQHLTKNIQCCICKIISGNVYNISIFSKDIFSAELSTSQCKTLFQYFICSKYWHPVNWWLNNGHQGSQKLNYPSQIQYQTITL